MIRESPGDRWAPWAVLALTLIALLAGWGLRAAVENRTRTLDDPATGVSLSVPAGWEVGAATDDVLLSARDPQDPLTQVRVSASDLGDRDVALAQQTYVFQLGQSLDNFRLIDAPENITLGADAGVRFRYAYVADPTANNPLGAGYPVVVAATATLVARGGTLYIITATLDAARLDDARAVERLDGVVNSVALP
jgi:hypothetical protein